MLKVRLSSTVALAITALLAFTTACSDSKPSHTAQRATPSASAAPAAVTSSGADAAAPMPTAAVRANASAATAATPPSSPRPSSTPATSAPAASDGPDPCALVTQAEAEAVLGGAASGPHRQRTSLLNQCQYAPATPSADPTDAVTVQLFPSNGPLTWQLRRDTFKKTDSTVQTVAGVGDEAFWVGDERTLFVTSHGVIFDVRVPGSGAAALATAKALAQTAVGRLA